MDCFICKKSLSMNYISKHFRLVHNLTEIDTYICTFGKDCNQFLSSFSALKKHFKCHLQKELLPNTTTCSIVPQSSSSTISLDPSTDECSFLINDNDLTNEIVTLAHTASQNQETRSIEETSVTFALQLHSNNNLTRKNVTDIQSSVLENIVNPIVRTLNQYFLESNCNFEERLRLTTLIHEVSDPFRGVETDHKLFQWLITNDYMQKYTEFTINREIGPIYRHGEIGYDDDNVTGCILPLSFQFKKVFEKNDQLIKTLKEQDRLSSQAADLNCHFINGTLWREKTKGFKQSNKIVLPFFLYIDDAEINNPLSSHCNPITFLYYSFPLIPDSEIYLAAVIKAKDYKEYGNEKCLSTLVREIKLIEENGIIISTSEGLKTVYFVLGLVIGDNLGLNCVLGFTGSFNHNFFCRFCKMTKQICNNSVTLNENLLRNRINYAEDVSTKNLSTTGIRESSIFHQISSFHVTTNFAVDVMHDVFEGVCHYNMCHIIKNLIDKNYFSLYTLNVRKQMFNYGKIEIGNLSPGISDNNLSKFHLKMTAREMMSFVHLFPLMVGDLVPSDDEVWLFLLQFLEIIEILMSFEISRDLTERLKSLIKCNHTDYIRLFKDTLKPKHHLMLHYYSVILQSGPPRYYWCFRFEAKNKEFKTYARNIASRKNICVSISKKFQLQFANLLVQTAFNPYAVKECHKIYTDHNDLIVSFCDRNKISRKFICYSSCTYKSKKFKKGYFISQYLDYEIDNALIYEIKEIVIFVDKLPYLVVEHATINKYDKHFAAFEINLDDSSEKQKDHSIVSIDSLSGPPVNAHKIVSGLNLIRPKQYY